MRAGFACAAGILVGAALAAGGEDPVALRVENLTVPPATGPLMHVVIQNRLQAEYQGTLSLQPPAGWRLNRTEQPLTLNPRETRRVAFAIERGTNLESNSYPVQVAAAGAGAQVIRKQSIACASAPFFKPRIGGSAKDWEDAIPVTFLSGGKKTVVRTYWNRSDFALRVEVEEDKLVPISRPPGASGFDAVQVALAPREAATGSAPSDKAARYEFLLVSSGSRRARGKCFLLCKPDMLLAATQEARELASLELREAVVAVKRGGNTTSYECAIPFSAMPEIKATEGREFRFSVLVHDPDGTGVRDWGEAAGLWPWQRSRLAWASWQGVQWGKEPPFDSAIEWGFCSSKR